MCTSSEKCLRMKFGKQFRCYLAQTVAVCIKNMLLLSFGMTLGFPTILIPALSDATSKESYHLNEEAISWIGSINLICVPVGCLFSGALTQPIGRKRTMQLVNFPFMLAWLLLKFSTDVWQVYLALCLMGLTGGLLEAPVITYVAEICQPQMRGILSSTSTMSVMLGVLLQFVLGTFLHWRTVAAVSSVFPLIAFILLCFVPESPHWLISKNRLVDAKKSIAWLRGWITSDEIDPEFRELCHFVGQSKVLGVDNPAFDVEPKSTNELKTTINESNTVDESTLEHPPVRSTKLSTVMLFTKKNFLWPYALVSFCFLLGHFSGMTTLTTFAVQIFASLRAPVDKYVATACLGLAELIGCIICVSVIRMLGKRVLSFVSLVTSGLCFGIVATYAYVIDVTCLSNNVVNLTNVTMSSDDHHREDGHSWIPLTFLILSALLSHTGIRILPWILTGELFSNETRATASGFSGGIGYIFGFLANKTFLSIVRHLTLPGTFYLNMGCSLIGCLVLYFILPETEGKSLHEITNHFNNGTKLGNKVKKKKQIEMSELSKKDHGSVSIS